MKLFHFSFLVLALSLLTFASCGSEGDDPATMSDLEGTWSAESLNADVNSTIVSPDFSSETDVQITAPALDYDVTFQGNTFTAEGEYTIAIVAEANGGTTTSSDNYTSVNNTGTFSTNANELTLNGSLFSLEYNGQPVIGAGGPQTANFSVSGDILTITQNQDTTIVANGFTTTSVVSSTSTWRRN